MAEVPPDAGLMVCSLNGRMLVRKKKAPYRQVAIPENVYRYILMWRAKIGRETGVVHEDQATFWRAWLAEKAERRSLGHIASRSIRQQVEQQVYAVQCEQTRLNKLIEGYADVRKFMVQLGLDPNNNWLAKANRVQERLEHVKQGDGQALLRLLDRFADQLQRFRGGLKEAMDETASDES
jgi:hypothetical protein